MLSDGMKITAMHKSIETSSLFSNVKIKIATSALEVIEKASVAAKYAETGGVLAGIGSIEQNEVIITNASLPGSKAKASRYFFQHDREFCQAFLDDLAAQTNGSIDYLGEWHKHFENVPNPSSTDIRTLTKIARNSDYHISFPLLLIIGQSNLRFSLRTFVIDNKEFFRPIKWEVLCPTD
jgi:integrative and conjugative element protein (TIGR02256 family)